MVDETVTIEVTVTKRSMVTVNGTRYRNGSGDGTWNGIYRGECNGSRTRYGNGNGTGNG